MNDEPIDETLPAALRRAIGELPREIAPARELWPGIASRIAATPVAAASPPLRGWLPLAAAATLVVSIASAFGGWLGYRAAAGELARNAAAADIARIELAYAGARAGYLRELALGNPGLPAPDRAALRESFDAIDHAAAELHGALATDPANPRYVDALVRTRDSEIDMLARLSDSPTTAL